MNDGCEMGRVFADAVQQPPHVIRTAGADDEAASTTSLELCAAPYLDDAVASCPEFPG